MLSAVPSHAHPATSVVTSAHPRPRSALQECVIVGLNWQGSLPTGATPSLRQPDPTRRGQRGELEEHGPATSAFFDHYNFIRSQLHSIESASFEVIPVDELNVGQGRLHNRRVVFAGTGKGELTPLGLTIRPAGGRIRPCS